MPRLLAVTTFVAASLTPALARPAAAPTANPATVLVTATVGESAKADMPQALWRKIVAAYVDARSPVFDGETTLADDARCRAAHAVYAVLATFDRAPRLPGVAQETDRAYGIARFTVRNCLSGETLPVKTVNLESDPVSEASRGDFEPNAERTWERSVTSALARQPLVKPLSRIVNVYNGTVLIERGPAFAVSQVLRGVADNAGASRPPFELIVTSTTGKYIEAVIIGRGDPRPGDYVEAAPASR